MKPLVQQEVGKQIVEAAHGAREAIDIVLADPKIRTHGLTQTQWSVLFAAKAALEMALP